MAVKVTIAIKSLQRIRQAAKDLHVRDTSVYIAKGTLFFELGGRVLKVEGITKEGNR